MPQPAWINAQTVIGGGDTSTPISAGALNNWVAEITDEVDAKTAALYADYVPEAYGAVGDGVTDDTDAFRDCILDAFANNEQATIYLGPKTYILDGNLVSANLGYSVIDLQAALSLKALRFKGVGTGHDARSVLKRTRTDDAYSATFGPPSMFGAATLENGSAFSWTGHMTFQDLMIELPEDSACSGIDGLGFGGMEIENVFVAYGGPAASPPDLNTNECAFGYRLPTSWDAGHVVLKTSRVSGAYAGIVANKTDHMVLQAPHVQFTTVAYGFEEVASGDLSHPGGSGYCMAEYNKYTLGGWDPVTGVKALSGAGNNIYLNDLTFDIEHSGAIVDPAGLYTHVAFLLDTNDKFRGQVRVFVLGLVTPGTIASGDASSLRIEMIHRGNTLPTVASGTLINAQPGWDVFFISGTTTIAAITNREAGAEITLIFTSTAQISDGGNLRLVGNFTGGANRVLKLVCDGSNWYEVARAAP